MKTFRSISSLSSGPNLGLSLATVALTSIAFLPNASAQTFSSWTDLYQGVEYSTAVETGPTPQNMFAMRIDLDAPGISFSTTPASPVAEADGANTISQSSGDFMVSQNAQVAVNGNFGDLVSTTPSPEHVLGYALSDGTVMAEATAGFETLSLSANNQATMGAVVAPDAYNAVSGLQTLANGVAITPSVNDGDPTGIDPRTEIGLSQNGQYLYFLVIDGRRSAATGVTDQQAGQILAELGAYNGFNVDGGGSSTLVASNNAGGVDVLNDPSDGHQRLVADTLAVSAQPLASGSPTSVTGKYSTAVMADKPVLYYQLNEGAGTSVMYDSSGNGMNGTYAASGITPGQASTPITSQPGTTVADNGAAGSHATVAHTASMSAPSFTIAVWDKPNANATNFQSMVSDRNIINGKSAGFILYDGPATGTSNSVYQFWLGGSTSTTFNYEGRNQNGFGLGPVATPGQWAFVVGTFQANGGPDATGRYTGTEDLYVNGVLELSLSDISYLPDTTQPLYIGASGNESAPSDQFDFNGDLSQVSLFDSALSQDQIDALYEAAAPEPTTYALLFVGMGALLLFRGRRLGQMTR